MFKRRTPKQAPSATPASHLNLSPNPNEPTLQDQLAAILHGPQGHIRLSALRQAIDSAGCPSPNGTPCGTCSCCTNRKANRQGTISRAITALQYALTCSLIVLAGVSAHYLMTPHPTNAAPFLTGALLTLGTITLLHNLRSRI